MSATSYNQGRTCGQPIKSLSSAPRLGFIGDCRLTDGPRDRQGRRPMRRDIPINLPETFKNEARELRNKLLLYRFHRRGNVKIDPSLADPALEPRLNQIM